MENMQSIPADLQAHHNSWFTRPLIEEPVVEDGGSESLVCSFPDPNLIALELDDRLRSTGAFSDMSIYSTIPARSEMEEITSDRSGSWGSCSSDAGVTASSANSSLSSLLNDIPPPTYNTMPSLGCFIWLTLLADHPLHDRPGSDRLTDDAHLMHTLSSYTSLGKQCSHNVPRFYGALPASDIPSIFDELASSPISMERSFFSPPAEDVPQSQDRHLSCILPDFTSETFPVHASEGKVEMQHSPETSTPSVSRNAGMVMPLAQRTYMAKSQKPPSSEAMVVYELGYRLDEDKSGIHDIVDYDKVAFPGKVFRQKASFRLEIEGFKPYTSQLNVNIVNGPPTKGRLAERTVDFMRDFLKKYEASGNPKSFPYKLHDLVLLRIELVSAGSIQPFFGVVTAEDTM